MIKGTTTSGFDFSIVDTLGDDFEFLELSVRADKGDIAVLPDLILRMLGLAQKNALMKHCTVDGRVSTERIMMEATDIFRVIREHGESAEKN